MTGQLTNLKPLRGISAAPITVACGTCLDCRLSNRRDWMIRLGHERACTPEACFVTLTYAPEHLPATEDLHYPHFQAFMKRLRRKIPKKLRYFMCGEYGDQLGRPHYHAVLFGTDFGFDRTPWKIRKGNQTWISETLTQTWGLGHCEIGSADDQALAYVAGYIMKKQTGLKAEYHYQKVCPMTGEVTTCLPEFSRMSSQPGIGADYVEKFHGDIFPRDSILHGNKEFPVPRYYHKLLERSHPQLASTLKTARQAKAEELRAENPTTRDKRLAATKAITVAKTKMFPRKN